jgi:hypothetical protein
VICIYLINFYQYIDARGTQILQNTNQYSYNMTIMIFIQVFIMILERYIGRTNVRRHNKSLDAKKILDDNKIEQQSMTGGITAVFTSKKTQSMTVLKILSKSQQSKVIEEE